MCKLLESWKDRALFFAALRPGRQIVGYPPRLKPRPFMFPSNRAQGALELGTDYHWGRVQAVCAPDRSQGFFLPMVVRMTLRLWLVRNDSCVAPGRGNDGSVGKEPAAPRFVEVTGELRILRLRR